MLRVRSPSFRTAAGRARPTRRRVRPRRAPEQARVDLDALSARWRIAFNAVEDALQAAGPCLAGAEQRALADRLGKERERTARLLDAVAHELRVPLVHRVNEPRPTKQMLGLPSGVAVCVFELEGVLTGSAAIHAAAWADAFDPLLLRRAELVGERFGPFAPFNPGTDYSTYLHGRARLDGVRSFLASRGIRLPEGAGDDPSGAETVHGLANRKAEALLRRLDAQGVKAYTGARRYLETAREAGLRCAVVSASAHSATILERSGLAGLVDALVDGNTITSRGLQAWPAPDVLLAACAALSTQPGQTALFETEPHGIAAGRAARCAFLVAVDRGGRAEALRGADVVVSDLSDLLDSALVLSEPVFRDDPRREEGDPRDDDDGRHR